MRTVFLFFFITVFFVQESYSQMKENADFIFINSQIYTVDPASGHAEAFAVSNGKFIGIGSSKDILLKYRSNEIIDGEGKSIYPGFIDAHCHFYGYAMGLQQVDLTGTRSFQEVLELLKKKAGEDTEGWLVGRGWDQNDWREHDFPDRKELDLIFPDRPVLLIRIDGHSALANGAALKIGGIIVGNKFQPGEVEIKDGWMTGLVSENATDHMRNTVPPADLRTRISLLKKAEQNCFSVGLTTVADAGLEFENINLIASLQQDKILKMRVYAMLSPSPENIHQFVEKGIYQNEHLNIRSIKLYTDGSLGSRTALLKSPYSDDPGNGGLLVNPIDSIKKICGLAIKYGYQVNTHAIGDSACKIILGIYGEFLKGKNDLRWRIEHAQVVDPSDIGLFNKYSIIPSVQATHATSDMYWAAYRLGKKRIKWAYAYKNLLGQNGWLPNGTDFPIEKISPILTFYAAVARKDLKGWPQNGFQVENALTREEALRSITIWAAKSCFEEKEKGSIEIGKYADFVILDKDLMKIPEAQLPDIKVLKTYIGGIKVYEKP
jgi:predicted amidohydrolase YtcJ